MRVAPTIELTDELESELTKLAQSACTSVRLAQRAKIVLLAAQGLQNKDIDHDRSTQNATAWAWLAQSRMLLRRLALHV